MRCPCTGRLTARASSSKTGRGKPDAAGNRRSWNAYPGTPPTGNAGHPEQTRQAILGRAGNRPWPLNTSRGAFRTTFGSLTASSSKSQCQDGPPSSKYAVNGTRIPGGSDCLLARPAQVGKRAAKLTGAEPSSSRGLRPFPSRALALSPQHARLHYGAPLACPWLHLAFRESWPSVPESGELQFCCRAGAALPSMRLPTLKRLFTARTGQLPIAALARHLKAHVPWPLVRCRNRSSPEGRTLA